VTGLEGYRRLLATYLGPQRGRVALLGVLLLGTIGLDVVNPLVLRYYIDRAAARDLLVVLIAAAVVYLAVAAVIQAVTIASTYFAETVGWTATNALRVDLVRHCLRLDMRFHRKRTPGELIERVDGDVTQLADFFSQSLVLVLGNVLLVGGILLALFLTDWRIGLVLSAYVACVVVLVLRIRGVASQVWVRARQASAMLLGFLEERLGGLEDVRAVNAGAYVLDRHHRLSVDLLRSQRAARVRATLVFIAMHTVYLLAYGGGLALGGLLYLDGVVSIGTVYLVVAYLAAVYRPLDQLSGQIQSLQSATASAGRVGELLALEPRVTDGRGAPLQAGPLSVELDGVSFAYAEDQEPVLRDVSLRLEPGRLLGLLGRTGSGKTTLVGLVSRLHDPTAGTVRLGGRDVRELRLDDLRDRVGVVTQDVHLFAGTVRDNLALFDDRIGDDEISRAIDLLGLRDWFGRLPRGLDTPLDSRGANLSAGEAQLLGLTRLVLREPSVVLLDEPTSRLDVGTERLLDRALSALLRDRTGIIVAHRLSTVDRVDEILIMDAGRVQEHGLRAELAADSRSRFAELKQVGLTEVVQ
jgi:ATP-binding cassette, subfamily B, bacterial